MSLAHTTSAPPPRSLRSPAPLMRGWACEWPLDTTTPAAGVVMATIHCRPRTSAPCYTPQEETVLPVRQSPAFYFCVGVMCTLRSDYLCKASCFPVKSALWPLVCFTQTYATHDVCLVSKHDWKICEATRTLASEDVRQSGREIWSNHRVCNPQVEDWKGHLCPPSYCP